MPVRRPEGTGVGCSPGARRRHIGGRRDAGRPPRLRRLLLRPPEVLRVGRGPVAGPPLPRRRRTGRQDPGLGTLGAGQPQPPDGHREFPARPDLQHAGAGHAVPSGPADRVDARRRGPRMGRRTVRGVVHRPVRLGRGVALRQPLRGRPCPAQPRGRHHRPRPRRRRRGGVEGAAGQRHRRHRVLSPARPQPAADRHVPGGRRRRRRGPHPGHRPRRRCSRLIPSQNPHPTATKPSSVTATMVTWSTRSWH